MLTRALLVLLVGHATLAFAQSPPPSPQAEALNEEGKQRYKALDYAGAEEKFRAAIAIAPDARYYFNLCATLEKVQRWDEALAACDEVYAHGADDALKAKTGQRSAEIRKRRASAPPAPPAPTQPGTPGAPQPGTAPPTTGPAPAPAPPPPPSASISETPPEGDYRWSLGAELGAASNRSIGQVFEKAGAAIKLHLDVTLLPRARIGARAYVDVFNFVQGGEVGALDLQITDVGGALFVHQRLSSNLYVTPLLGVHVGILQPSGFDGEPFAAFGFRAEGALTYVLQDHHALNASVLLSGYLPASGDRATLDPAFFGLDESGALWAFTVGYTYRFKGAGIPGFIVLE